jgi:ABC-2 type transport system ATP-binding protein
MHMTPSGPTISVENLTKIYQVPEREGGFGAAVRSFFKRVYRDVRAVDQVSFQIQPGEVVGFLGPNGAGKTTTLKMLSGLLHPSSGKAQVLGFTPWELKPDYLRSMTLVMGQRNRLSWDIPAADSFLLNQAIYRIPDNEFKQTLDELDELLDLAAIIKKPVRNLSLGERMKCELAAGLLHRPKVLFLDEPTIGLDISAQVRIRAFLQEYNRRSGATILLTSHYMADVTALCERVIIIHQGHLKYDGGLNDLARKIAPFKLIGVSLGAAGLPDLSAYGTPAQSDDDSEKSYIQVRADQVTSVTARLLADLPVHDISITDPPIEAVIEQAFQG